MSKKTEKIKSFSEVYKGASLNSAGQLIELVGKEIILRDVEFSELGSYGEVAVVTVEYDGNVERRHTFSSVLIKQLKAIQSELPVKTVIKKRKRYYTFT